MFRHRKIGIFLVIGILLMTFTPPACASSVDEVRELVQDYYVDVPPAGIMQAETVDKILEMIGDPHTTYFTREEYEEFVEAVDQKFSGIGIYMDMVPGGVKVLSVIKGAPAEKAGIKYGDIITRAGDKSLKGLTSEESMALLRGPEGSEVRLTVQRVERTFEVTVMRQEVEVPTVSGQVINKGKTGYIDIDSFGSDTATEFGKEVKTLQGAGVKNWIIDLRDNTGGYLETAFEMAGYLIGEKPVINVKERDYSEVCTGVKQEVMINGPVVVLVNEYSASASEVLTGALQDYHRALVLGAKTYGKGTVQQIFKLSEGDVLKLTIARFYSPDGGIIDHRGITPDLAADEDTDALVLAEALLSGKEVNFPEIKGIPADMPFVVNIPGEFKSGSTPEMVLIQSNNGRVVPVRIKTDGKGRAVVIPGEILQPGTEYWLLTGSTKPGEGMIMVGVMGSR